MNPFDLLLIASATALMAYVLVVLGLRVSPQVRRAGSYVRDTVNAPFIDHLHAASHGRRFADLEAEVREALGIDRQDDARVREDVVRAAQAAQFITILNQNMRRTVTQCLSTHWAVAQGLGAVDMAEAARHPLSAGLRQRVIDLSELLSQHLEHYPLLLESPELIRLQLGIRWIAPTCTTCPYFTSAVATAPRLCPTARAMQPRQSTNGVVDGEIVDDCDGGTA